MALPELQTSAHAEQQMSGPPNHACRDEQRGERRSRLEPVRYREIREENRRREKKREREKGTPSVCIYPELMDRCFFSVWSVDEER